MPPPPNNFNMQVTAATEYLQLMTSAGIILDPEQRADVIWTDVRRLAAHVGGSVPPETRDSLLPEVNQLVEAPTAVLGNFDSKFLQLPR